MSVLIPDVMLDEVFLTFVALYNTTHVEGGDLEKLWNEVCEQNPQMAVLFEQACADEELFKALLDHIKEDEPSATPTPEVEGTSPTHQEAVRIARKVTGDNFGSAQIEMAEPEPAEAEAQTEDTDQDTTQNTTVMQIRARLAKVTMPAHSARIDPEVWDAAYHLLFSSLANLFREGHIFHVTTWPGRRGETISAMTIMQRRLGELLDSEPEIDEEEAALQVINEFVEKGEVVDVSGEAAAILAKAQEINPRIDHLAPIVNTEEGPLRLDEMAYACRKATEEGKEPPPYAEIARTWVDALGINGWRDQ